MNVVRNILDLVSDNETESASDHPTILHLDTILVDPTVNVSRGGRMYPIDHPKVVAVETSLQRVGLLEGLGVQPLPAPVERALCKFPCCTTALRASTDPLEGVHRYKLIYGFVRFAALRRAGLHHLDRTNGEAKIAGVDADTEKANAHENLFRSDPTEAQLALAFLGWKKTRGATDADIAKETGYSTMRVAMMTRIAERCPLELIDRWEAAPTKEVRIALARVADTTDPHNELPEIDRHRAMVAAWEAHCEAQAAALSAAPTDTATTPTGRPARTGRTGTKHALPRPLLDRLLGQVDGATRVVDTASGVSVELTDNLRTVLAAVLRYAAGPQTPSPFR